MLPEVAHPGIFPPETRAQATAFACSLPKEQGLPLARHSSESITRQLIETGQVKKIACSTIRRWLAAEKLKPWRFRLWQHIVDPKAFLKRAKPVLRLYQHAKALLERGVWVVCCDEKTSLQARQPEQASVATAKGQNAKLNGRYKRMGAIQFFGALSVADGKIMGMCREQKCFVDFQALITQTILPEALRRQVKRVVLIMDNGRTHAPKQLQNWLNEELKQRKLSLSVKVQWLPVRASWLDQIEIWFSKLQSKVLRPNDFASVAALVGAIEQFMDYSNTNAQPIKWTYTVEKLERKLAANL
jgi:hypothetical protein